MNSIMTSSMILANKVSCSWWWYVKYLIKEILKLLMQMNIRRKELKLNNIFNLNTVRNETSSKVNTKTLKIDHFCTDHTNVSWL